MKQTIEKWVDRARRNFPEAAKYALGHEGALGGIAVYTACKLLVEPTPKGLYKGLSEAIGFTVLWNGTCWMLFDLEKMDRESNYE